MKTILLLLIVLCASGCDTNAFDCERICPYGVKNFEATVFGSSKGNKCECLTKDDICK
jgi:hypothetical protein